RIDVMSKKKVDVTTKPKKPFFTWIKDNKTFMVALSIILFLMIIVFILSQVLPAGEYKEQGGEYIYEEVTNNFPFWKFLLSPFLLFGTNAGKSVAIIITFLFIISGAMEVMGKSHVLTYVFDRIVEKFKNHQHLLLVIVVTFFMAVGSLIGCYDEIVPFVPLLIFLVAKFGFDKYVGITVSLFAISAGFATGIFNPFIVAIPQQQAGVPTFSGMWMRIVAFFVLLFFTCGYVLLKSRKRQEIKATEVDDSLVKEHDPILSKAGIAFGLSILLGFTLVILTLFVPAFEPVKEGGYSLLLLAAAFLLGSVLTAFITKIPPKAFFGNFTKGIRSTLMAGILLVLASSISYTLTESQRMHTILHGFVSVTTGISPLGYIFMFYGLFLLFGLFIASGSARAFLLIPVLAPIAQAYGVLYPTFLAFALADGMTSLLFPTNPILIVILNITKTSYGDYVKKNWVYFLGFFLLSILMICFAYAVGYNALPF
ncbi:MAG: hypothetical protein MJ208_03955, partial [Bacilli bacterium]|nr:hypothetical protein [Bacilli bacterium]